MRARSHAAYGWLISRSKQIWVFLWGIPSQWSFIFRLKLSHPETPPLINWDVEPGLSKCRQEKQNPLSFKDEYSIVGNLVYQFMTKRLSLPLITVIGKSCNDGLSNLGLIRLHIRLMDLLHSFCWTRFQGVNTYRGMVDWMVNELIMRDERDEKNYQCRIRTQLYDRYIIEIEI